MNSPDIVRIGVIGTGYLGAVHATCMADLGHDVVAVDIDSERVSALAAGAPDFFEPGLVELLERTLSTGRLRFTTDYAALSGVDVVFLCVGTPQVVGGAQANTAYLFEAVRHLVPHLGEQTLVVGKSTVPVGTAAELAAVLAEEAGHPVRLAWNPEFLREGHALRDTQEPSRLVYGVAPQSAKEDTALLDEVYAGALDEGVPRIVTSLATAELVKGAANSFLATKISFINTIADLCEAARSRRLRSGRSARSGRTDRARVSRRRPGVRRRLSPEGHPRFRSSSRGVWGSRRRRTCSRSSTTSTSAAARKSSPSPPTCSAACVTAPSPSSASHSSQAAMTSATRQRSRSRPAGRAGASSGSMIPARSS